MSGALLRSGKLAEFKAMAEDGQPVFLSALQLREAIRLQLGREMANHLAIPQRNESGDKIDWYAPSPGDVVPWSAATDDEKREGKAELEQMQSRLIQLGANMRRLAQRERQTFGRLLEKVIHFPDDSHVYLVEGKPVLTFWGFVDPSTAVPDDPLAKLQPTPLASTAAPPVGPAVSTAVVTRRRRPWWLWLLMLLLLGLLLWLLRGCMGETPDGGVVQVQPEDRTELVKPTMPYPDQDSVRADEGGSGGLVSGQGVAGSPDAVPGQPPLEPEGPVKEGFPAEAAKEPAGPADELATDDQAPEKTPPPQPEVPPEQQKMPPGGETEPSAAAEEMPSPPEPEAPTNADTPQAPAKPIEIPPGAAQSGSTGFLNGKWNAGGGIQDARTGKPMRLNYDFKDGKGKVTVRGSNGIECVGDVSAAMNGGGLAIKNTGQAKCADGSSYRLPEVRCKPGATSAADCSGSYDDQKRFPMSIKKSQTP